MWHRMRLKSSRLLMAMVVTAVLGCAALLGVTQAPVAHACPATAACATYVWPYAHSWYITDTSQSAIQNLAAGDASWSNNACANNPQLGAVDFLTILDFGRPGLYNGVYQTYDFGSWLPFNGANGSTPTVQQVAQWYADTWYNDSTSCPRLHLAIGTANDYECYNGSFNTSCNVYTAGQQWDAIAHNVQSHLSSEGYSWQETIWTGDDLEGGWDQWTCSSGCSTNPETQNFVNGMAQQESSYSSHANMVDYGDAGFGQANIQGGPVWTPQNIYDASWGIGWGVPAAEVYVPSQLNAWACVFNNNCNSNNSLCNNNCGINESQGQMSFYSAQTQCSEADTLPTGNCWVQRSNECQASPYEAYNNLNAATNNDGGVNIPYSDNIRWQTDGTTGNNGC